MKTAISLFAAVFTAFLASAQENLIKNGSFEDWPEDSLLPKNWGAYNIEKQKGKIICSTDVFSDGKKAVLFKDAGLGNKIFQSVSVKPGEVYDISCRVKTEISMYEFRLFYYFKDGDGKRIPEVKDGRAVSGIPYARVKTDWTAIELKNIIAPETAARLYVELVPNDAWSKRNVPGSIWVDDVCVRKSSSVSSEKKNYTPAYEAALFDKLDITVDGKAEEAEWENASFIRHLVSPGVFSPEGTPTKIRLLADREALYLFAEMERNPATPRTDRKEPQKRDGGVFNDVIEVFLRPQDGRDEQYHFMFDDSGSIWDSKQVFIPYGKPIPWKNGLRTKNDTAWNAETLEIKADSQEKHWTLEAKIPFAELGMKAPADGTVMTANFCRADYGNGTSHNLLTAWALHKIVAFANYEEFGTLTFVKDPASIFNADVEAGVNQAAVVIRPVKDFDGKITVEEQLEDGRCIVLGEQSFHAAAGKKENVKVPLASQGILNWISVYDKDGKLISRRGGLPYGKMLFIDLVDPMKIRKGAVFIPNDTRWYTHFRIRHTLTGKTGNKIYGNPLNARIIAEVPEGITIPYLVYSNWGGDNEAKKPLKEESVTKNGQKYVRYELETYISGVNRPLIFFSSTLPAGTKGKLYLYMKWDGGEQMPVEHDFTVVSFGRVKPFERMQLRMDDLTPRLAQYITDDPAKELPALGINVFRIPFQLKGGYYAETKETREQRYSRLIREMKDSGIKWYFCIQNDLNNALIFWCNKTTWGNPLKMTPDLSVRVKTIDGEDRRNQFGWYSPCPRYRGENFKKQVQGILDSVPVKQFGVTWLVLDWEFWDHPCYCDACVKIHWPAYLKERDLPDYGDPRIFMKDENKNPEAAREWHKFFELSRGSLYVDLKKELNKNLTPGRTEWNAPKSGTFVLSDWIIPQPHLLDGLDYFDWPYAYVSPDARVETVRKIYTEVTGGSSRQIVASVNSMQGCELNEQYPPISAYYNILESAALGVRGFEWWFAPVIEAMSYKYIMDGLRQIRPFEDIILDGKVTVHTEAEKCSFRKVEWNGEALYCVRNYALKEPAKVSFTVNANQGDSVYDTATGAKLMELKDGGNTVPLLLDADHQAKLLYVGKNYPQRIKKASPDAGKTAEKE